MNRRKPIINAPILHTHPALTAHTKEHEADPYFATCGYGHPISPSDCPAVSDIISLLLDILSLRQNHSKQQHFANTANNSMSMRISIISISIQCVCYTGVTSRWLISRMGDAFVALYYYVFVVWNQLFGFIRFVLYYSCTTYARPKSRKANCFCPSTSCRALKAFTQHAIVKV